MRAVAGNIVRYETDPITGGIELSAGGVAVSGYVAPVSQYDRALIFAAPIRQNNAVRDYGQNINDAQYVGAITDAEVYDTEAGALSVGQATSKALAFHEEKMRWDLSANTDLSKVVAGGGLNNIHINHAGVCWAAGVWRDALIAGGHI